MKEKIKYLALSLFAGSKILDLISTIIQSPEAEENPIVRYVWINYGNLGLILYFVLATILVIWIAHKFNKTIVYLWLILLSIFVILIGLTNLNLIPYRWTSWFVFPL